MKIIRLSILLLGLFVATLTFSQISHGETPYFLQPSIMRATSGTFFVEMPSFDLDSLLMEDDINKGNMRGSYRFAHKFHTHIDSKDAMQTILPDGTTVKQMGIRSAGAYSINLLLNDFEIPPGGKLFIYSADYSHVIGSFDDRNNSPDKILPIQPVAGEAIIVEYSEPANVPFAGHFTIAEVNHDYRDILRVEPKGDNIAAYTCMPDAFCENAAEEAIRSTVLLIINGNTLCSGSLLNNTKDDGKPYLLTAVHCFVDDQSKEFPTDKKFYNDRAATIVAFFNYNRPICDANIKMKGTEEMSLAGASARAIVSRKDIALFEFLESPPDYYNAYYAGWKRDLNAEGGKHINLHHPSGAVKKYGMTNEMIRIISSTPADNILDSNSFWQVPNWSVGSTHEGSSGSPLFNENKLIIGALTGGISRCASDKGPDYFSALGKGWENNDPGNQLKTYLNPSNKEVMQHPGKDPNLANPVIRLANARYTKGDLLITSELSSPNQGFVFGNSNLKTLEFAEEFNMANSAEIFGTYLLIPAMPFTSTSGVTVSVYTGKSFPETKIYSTRFIPKYLNYNSSGFSMVNKEVSQIPTETFVVFDKPVAVGKKFFISYSIDFSTSSKFCVYNTKWSDNSHPNTAWLKTEKKGWIPADAYEFQPMKTSLAIQPLLRNKNNSQIEIVKPTVNTAFVYERTGRVLVLKEPLSAPGQIAIYSVGGQLLEKIAVQQDQTTFILSEKPKGTIGIVKIINNNFVYTGKIMY